MKDGILIGTTAYDVTDETRVETAIGGRGKRRLHIQILYPARSTNNCIQATNRSISLTAALEKNWAQYGAMRGF